MFRDMLKRIKFIVLAVLGSTRESNQYSGGVHIDVVGEFKMVYPGRYNQISVSLTPNYALRVANYLKQKRG